MMLGDHRARGLRAGLQLTRTQSTDDDAPNPRVETGYFLIPFVLAVPFELQ